MFSFPAIDHMIAENKWICPIKPTYGDNAYFSISKNEIVIPEKRQFKSGESYYSNLAHEMTNPNFLFIRTFVANLLILCINLYQMLELNFKNPSYIM